MEPIEKPTPEATYERARRLANVVCLTIALQRRRIQSSEPEDSQFNNRRWADYEFLINALSRLRKIAILAQNVPPIKSKLEVAIAEFDRLLPFLAIMRNTLEHIDEYAIDEGRNGNISRKELEVGRFGTNELEWLGYTLKIEDVMEATNLLFKAIKDGAGEITEYTNMAYQVNELQKKAITIVCRARFGNVPIVIDRSEQCIWGHLSTNRDDGRPSMMESLRWPVETDTKLGDAIKEKILNDSASRDEIIEALEALGLAQD